MSEFIPEKASAMDKPLHDWNLAPADARALQAELARRVVLHPDSRRVQLIGGVDVGFEDAGQTTRAALVVLTFPELEVVERQLSRLPTSFPYVPGLLSFREIPAILQAWSQLAQKPDLLFCDGQGIAHPRRFGIACHLGIWLDLPTIGVGKSRLIGSHEEPGPAMGDAATLEHKGARIGTVLRSKVRCKPLYISPGHRMDHQGAVDWVMRCLTRYRLPEPTRQAHNLASLEK